jgi:hypothetical protein
VWSTASRQPTNRGPLMGWAADAAGGGRGGEEGPAKRGQGGEERHALLDQLGVLRALAWPGCCRRAAPLWREDVRYQMVSTNGVCPQPPSPTVPFV